MFGVGERADEPAASVISGMSVTVAASLSAGVRRGRAPKPSSVPGSNSGESGSSRVDGKRPKGPETETGCCAERIALPVLWIV